jgi:hypothetical protein
MSEARTKTSQTLRPQDHHAGAPKVGYTQLYGAPGVAGVSILSV